jgi:hypothetical protein
MKRVVYINIVFIYFLFFNSLSGAGGKKKVVLIPRDPSVQQVVYRIKFSRGILNFYSVQNDTFLFKGTLRQQFDRPVVEEYVSDGEQHVYLSLKEFEKKHEDDSRVSVQLKSFKIPTDNHWELIATHSVSSRYDISLGAVLGEFKFNDYALNEMNIESGASEVTLIFSRPNRTVCDLIEMEVGASKFTAMQLGNARVRKIVYKAGVGKSSLDFSGVGYEKTEVFIENGMGLIKLYVPTNVGAKFIKEAGFLSSFEIDDVIKKGDVYYSLNYEKADVKYIFHITSSLGRVEVIWIEPE